MRNQTSYKINSFEAAVNDTKKDTLWKIKDCEDLLQKRVTAEFVDQTCKNLEDKLKKEIAKTKEESFGDI